MLNLPYKIFKDLILIAGIILLLSSCDGRPKGVLSLNDMTDVLTEMHKTDASLNERGLAYGHYTDKAPYYKFIFKKYGISKAQFDSSLVWYSKNPRIFGNMYDKVLINLTSLQKDVKNGKYHPVDTLDLRKMSTYIWNKRPKYLLTKDSARTHLNFEIIDSNFMFGDVYVMKFLQRIAPEDSCKKPRVVFRINYENGKTDSIYSKTYNDSLLRRYTIRFKAFRKLKIKSVSGELLASETYKGKQNSVTDSISLMREYNAKIQDSLRKVVESASPGFRNLQNNSVMNTQRAVKKSINRRFYHSMQ